jgi:hypothetical protein
MKTVRSLGKCKPKSLNPIQNTEEKIGKMSMISRKNYLIKKTVRFFLFAYFLHFCVSSAFANEISILTTVDKNHGTLEDVFNLTITVKGVRNSPKPILPPIPNFSIRQSGTQSSITIVNGEMTSSTKHNFLLTPKKPGKFTINSAKLEYKGQEYFSNAIQVEINDAPKQTVNNQAPVFAETFASTTTPYVNEQLTFTFKLYRRVQTKNIQLNIPFDNFREEQLGKSRDYSEVLNGLQYQTSEFSTALFPTKTGEIEIPGASVNLDLVIKNRRSQPQDPFNLLFNDPFFGHSGRLQHKVIRTKPIAINVRPLPEKGKPSDFSNLVGEFKISTTMGKIKIKAGDTSTLTVKVFGEGNIQDAILTLPDFTKDFKTYSDEPKLEKSARNQKLYGEKTFKFALVPLKEGSFQIPSLTLSYFDPSKKHYVTTKTNSIQLEVLPGENDEKMNLVDSKNLTQGKVKILGTDIFPNHTNLADFSNQEPTKEVKSIYYAGGLVPILSYIVIAAFARQKRKLRHDSAFARNKKAYKLAKIKLDSLSSKNHNPKNFIQELSQILREYIGDKLNLNGAAFTAVEAISKLKEKEFPEEQIISIQKLLEKLEKIQYGGTEMTTDFQENLIDQSLETLKKLEKLS